MYLKEMLTPVLRAGLATFGAGLLLCAAPAFADDLSGDLVFLNWQGGSELDTIHQLEKAFEAHHPAVHIKEVEVTYSGEPTGAIRSMLMGGEKADLMISAWPALRDEFATNGLLRPFDDAWAKYGWDKALDPEWKKAGSFDGKVYGIAYTFGNRSAIWYKTSTLKKLGIAPPKTWDEFLKDFAPMKAAGLVPVEIPAKVWAHQEWFQTLVSRVGGSDLVEKLAQHQIAWTDPQIKTVLKKWQQMLKAGCCADPATMLGTEWDAAADNVLKTGTSGFELIGMWLNQRAITDYNLKEGVDYSLFPFPAIGMGHDNAFQVDGKEYIAFANGQNPAAADAFVDFALSKEGADIIAKSGIASTSKNADASLYGPVTKASIDAIGSNADVHFDLADVLPTEVSIEMHTQLQKFLQDPSDANIDAVLQAMEAKAQDVQ